MNKFDSIVQGALEIAQSKALELRSAELDVWHLLFGLVANPSSYASRTLKEHKNTIIQRLESLPKLAKQQPIDQLRPSSKLSEWLTRASGHAIQGSRQEVSEKDLLRFLPQIFPDLQIDYSKLNSEEDEQGEVPSFLVNLNELAEKGKLDPVIGRSREIRAVMEILGRRSKNNPVLVGPAGVGKTAIVEGLAERIVRDEVPDVLKGKVVYSLNMGSLMAGTKYRGEFEERLEGLLKFIKAHAEEAILFIDEIHQLVGAGKTDGAMDAANLLKPALARGELNCIGATTTDEYRKYILGDSALDRRFRSVPVNEPSKEDAIEIMMGIKDKLEIHHGIKISDEAVYHSVMLSDQYITDKHLPDKSIDLVDEACSSLKLSAEAMPTKLVEKEGLLRAKKIQAQVEPDNPDIKSEIARLEHEFKEGKERWEQEVLNIKRISDLKNQYDRLKFELDEAQRKQDYELASKLMYSLIPEVKQQLDEVQHEWILAPKHIAQVISRQTGIPVEKILKSKQEHILELEAYLNDRVYGQTESLREIAQTLVTSHAGLSDPSRPLGSFLLKGPSGVGKTETAKALSQFLFNTEDNLIRFDLSEFSEKHSVAKLIGSPAGYVGYDDGGQLTEAVRRRPYSIILFDEIEKAHRDFSDILLQILDDGRLTDNKGRTINFKNTIILLTTNSKDIESDFKPEVLGRLDAICSYRPLDQGIMKSLIDREVLTLNQRLTTMKMKVELSAEVYEKLAKEGYDPRYGARPLNGLFRRLITRPLSELVISGGADGAKFKALMVDDKIQLKREDFLSPLAP